MKLLSVILILLTIKTSISVETRNPNGYQNDPLIVKTQNGFVRGTLDLTIGDNKSYYVFQSIPYAEPPVGNLRFEPPVHVQNWDGILNATEYRSNCVQLSNLGQGTEDCLHLNIYTPKTGYSHRLAVMVWIHGGGFTDLGSRKEYFGPDFFIDHNVVVVALNYRLNIFGFLSTGDLVVPGNNGLKDQALALLWIKKNIRAFGGDPGRITIFGMSAGAASIGYHLTARKTNGLYRNAILQCGTNLDIWSLARQTNSVLATLSQIFNSTSTQDLIDKMRLADVQTISLIASQLSNDLNTDFGATVFGPVIEPNHSGAYITGKTYQLYSQKKFYHVPVIIGFNSFEALNFWQLISQLINTNATSLVPVDLNLANQNEYDIVQQKVEEQYFNNQPLSTQLYQALQVFRKLLDGTESNFYSDNMFVRSARELALLISKYVRVYFYVFSYEGTLVPDRNLPFPGVGHADNRYYMWRIESNETTIPSDTDILVRNRIVKLWTNFAKNNYPTTLLPDPELNYFLWPQARIIGNNLLYVNITEKFKIEFNPHKDNMEFWDEIYSEHGNPPFDTY